MSLIDDALKRAQQAAEREGAPRKSRPWSPAPLPDAGLARRRHAVRLAGWAVGGAAAVAVAALLARLVWDAAAPGHRADSATPTSASMPALTPTFAESLVPTPVVAAAVPVAARPKPTRAATPAAAASQGGAETGETEVPVPAGPPRPVSDGRSYARSVELPGGARIELGGIVWSEDQPRALLNDRIVGVDAYIEGFTVAGIEEERVTLVRDGVTIYLTLK